MTRTAATVVALAGLALIGLGWLTGHPGRALAGRLVFSPNIAIHHSIRLVERLIR